MSAASTSSHSDVVTKIGLSKEKKGREVFTVHIFKTVILTVSRHSMKLGKTCFFPILKTCKQIYSL